MKRLSGKLFLVFSLAFIVIDLSRALAPRVPGLSNAAPLAFYAWAALLALALSALLARYLEQPVRILRHAFAALSDGKLDTQVRHLLGSRRDALADLVGDFDGMARRLQEQIAAQQRLVHEVSHELRSPLSRLQMAIGLAQQDPQRFHATLDRIENESLRLQTMLENMLTLAQLESPDREMPTQPADPFDVLAEAVRDARFEAQARRTRLIFDEHGARRALQLPLDAHGLARAFDNVLRNAVAYGGDRVEITVLQTAASWQVAIADRGPGVDPDALALIFEPFYRLPQARRRGFGLGLAIARRAVLRHGGSISAANRDGGGLVVTIALPRDGMTADRVE